MKQLLLALLTALLSVSGLARGKAATVSTNDHLVPVGELPLGLEYKKLWQKKLLLTPGDVARCVWLSGNVGSEGALSIYKDNGRKGGMYGGYWVTVTQASSPLWRQLGDTAGIVAVQAEALNKQYLREWAAKLDVTGELERLLSGGTKPKNT